MAANGIDESHRDEFVRHAVHYDNDNNNYLKKAEIEAAASAWVSERSEEAPEENQSESTDSSDEGTEPKMEEDTSDSEENPVEEVTEDVVEEATEDAVEEDQETSEQKACPICSDMVALDAMACPSCGFAFD